MIGDKDPEDAYDVVDPPNVRLEILERVVADLRARDDGRNAFRRTDALRLVDRLRDERGVDQRRLRQVRRDLQAL